MAKNTFTYCPKCAKELITREAGDRERQVCPDSTCGFVHWDNPTPVVAAIVEFEGKIILVRSIGWPQGWYGLVTGFLEKGEMPEEAVLREVKEETGLDGTLGAYIGMYPFYRMNQLILAYHVHVESGTIQIDESELEGYKEVPIEQVRPWPSGTGVALRDWLRTRGIEKEFIKWEELGITNRES